MKIDIARAWKDENYRQSLSAEELSLLPENPAGALDLSEQELEAINGGFASSNGWGGNESHRGGNTQIVSAFVICLVTTAVAFCFNFN